MYNKRLLQLLKLRERLLEHWLQRKQDRVQILADLMDVENEIFETSQQGYSLISTEDEKEGSNLP